MRGATGMIWDSWDSSNISIHAPRAGRDDDHVPRTYYPDPISIHAPRAGRDNIHLVDLWAQEIFQSTRPVRGATRAGIGCTPSARFQSTRPVRGATADIPVDILPRLISIHAPRAGRDSKFMLLCR